MAETGLGYSFEVTIDGGGVAHLGIWTECSGLNVECQVETYQEGGQNGFEHKLPTRLTYSNITLKRPLDRDSRLVANWFSSLEGDIRRQTASIKVFDGNRKAIAEWTLQGVVPVKWSGPSFGSSGNNIAEETLELAHHGFSNRRP